MNEVLEVLEALEVGDVSAVISQQVNNACTSVHVKSNVQSNYTGH